MTMTNIQDIGDAAVQQLRLIVPEVQLPNTGKEPKGDAYYVLPDDPSQHQHWMEVKGGKPNQVRPIAMLTLVFLHVGYWYVVPAHDLLAYTAMLQRGHHGYDPLDCCQLNVSAQFDKFKVTSNSDLKPRIEAAIRGTLALATALDAILTPYVEQRKMLMGSILGVRATILSTPAFGAWNPADLKMIAQRSEERARK